MINEELDKAVIGCKSKFGTPTGVATIGSFSWALMRLKEGAKVQRKGWNGKGMFLYLTKGSEVPAVNMKPETAKHLFGESLLECDTIIKINSHIDMKTADGSITIGWAPSQVDMLAEDWEVVE